MWPNPQFPADLVTFTEEIINEKLHARTVVRNADVYSDHCHTSKIERFAKIVNG